MSNPTFPPTQDWGPFSAPSLPIGYVDPESGDVVQDFELRELSAREVRLIRDPVKIRKNPFRWLGTSAAFCLETLGGSPLTPQDLGVPSPLHRVPLRDLEYLLIAAHVWNYGTTAKLRFVCAQCETKNEASYDLSLVEIFETPEGFDPKAPISVPLRRGVTLGGLTKHNQDPDLVYDTIVFQMPLLEHALKVEKSYKKNRKQFDIGLLAEVMVGLQATPIIEKDGEQVPQAHFEEVSPMEAKVILERLSAADWDLVNRMIDDLPGINRRVATRCEECDAVTETGVDPTSLFLVGS
jgi:hypothetical protein